MTGGNGILQAVLKVTDETFKQSSQGLQLNVDNTLPTGIWNYNSALTDQAGVYTFYGNETNGGDYLLIGSAEDTGTISGVDRIEAYFVKNSRFYNPTVDNSGGIVDAPLVGADTSAIPDMSGTPQTIPFPPAADYVINIDNRAERGIYDTDPTDGDNDGFQESLRSKGIYDEWFVYFDTELFPDGPIDLYYVVYDTAGNMAYELVSSQISNNPPTITQVDVGTNAGSANPYTGLFKQSNSLYISVSATDVEGIDTSSYKATLVDKVVAPNGAPSTDGPALNSVWPMAADGTVTIDVREDPDTAFDSGVQYTLELEVRDTDGNIITYPIEFWLDNNDITLPKVDIDAFTQEHLSGLNGHLEEDGDSLINGSDADVSGTIKVSGTAWDDNTISSIQLSFDGGTTWVTTDTQNIESTDPILGTDYTWSYIWDTTENHGAVTADAAYNRTIRVRATDSNSNIGILADGGVDPTMTVDVVPYITGITGTGFDTGLLTYVKRSAAGNYPIVVGSTITVNGYNLPATAAGAFSIGGTNLSAGSATGTTSMTVDLLTTDTSGEIIVTTAGVPSSNNSNDDLLPQNQEDNPYNDNLDDDRSGVFWDVSSLSGTSSISDPAMHPNAAGTDYDWMYVKNGKDLFLLPGGSSETKLTGATGLSGGDFTYNSDGTLMFLYNHDAQWSFADNSYRFTGGVQWGAVPNLGGFTFTSGRDEAYNWNHDEGIPKVGLGNVSFNDAGGTLPNTPGIGDLSYPYSNLDLNRYRNLNVRTVGGDTATRNYVAYFDSGALESRSIVFYAFKTGTDIPSVQGGVDLYYGDETSATKLEPWIPMAIDTGTAVNGEYWYANIDKHFMSADDYSVALTGNQLNNDTGIATPRGRQEVTTFNSGNDSEDFDLGIHVVSATEHHGFIAYFDESSSSLKITANESLYTADPTGTLGAWTAPYTVDNNSGADVAIAVDPDGGIHLAYQDVSAGYLKYSYLTYNAGTDTFTTVEQVFVDALFGAGANNSIAVRDFGTGDYRPIILTFSSAYTGTIAPLRMSYPFFGPGDAGFDAGADSATGAFLGNWETIALPAGSNPVSLKNFLYVDGSGNVQVGYKGSNLEEAGYLGF